MFWLCSFFFRRTENNFCFLHFIRNNDFPNVVVIFGFALFFWRTGNLFLALLVSIDHSHSISRHKPSQKFNMCDFVARSQAFVVKAVIACDYWCPYIVKHRALLCVQLTHVWKPGLTFASGCEAWAVICWWLPPMETENAVYTKCFLTPGKTETNQETIL